jgi:hypothetical protein
VDEVSTATGRYMNVVGVPHLTDKFTRIATISSLVENGTIRFCLDGTQKALISQLLYLGKIKDDLAGALESAVSLARGMNFRPAMAIAGSSAGVGERQPQQARGILSQMFIQQAMRSQERGATAAPGEFVQRGRASVWQTRR